MHVKNCLSILVLNSWLILLAGCSPPSPTAATPVRLEATTPVELERATPVPSLAPTLPPTDSPTAAPTRTRRLTSTPTRFLPPPSLTATPQPLSLPLYGQAANYEGQVFQVPGFAKVSNKAPEPLGAWVETRHGQGFTECVFHAPGGKEEHTVVRIQVDDTKMLAEKDDLKGRQQVLIEDCALSGDAQRVAFMLIGGGAQWWDRSTIYTVNLDGSDLTRRTPSEVDLFYWHPSWNPQRLVLYYNACYDCVIQALDFETGRRVTLAEPLQGRGEYGYGASISPDGRWMLVPHYQGLFLIDLEDDQYPMYKIRDGFYLYSGWSPDGMHILADYSGGQEVNRAYLLRLAPAAAGSEAPVRVMEVGYQEHGLSEPLHWLPWDTPVKSQPVCNGQAQSWLAPGDYATNNPESRVLPVLRTAPGGGSAALGSYRKGGRVLVLDGPLCDGNQAWWLVLDPWLDLTAWVMEAEGNTRWLLPLIPPEGRQPLPADWRIREQTMCDGLPCGSATAAPTVPSACPGGLPPRLVIGGQARVSTANSAPNRLRDAPSRGGTLLGELLPGTTMEVLEGPSCADELTWWRVQARVAGKELTGWTAEGDGAEYWLEPLP